MKAILAFALVALVACSAEQAYNAGQGWQRNQCNGIPDKAEYDRCIERSGPGYGTYRKETRQP
jgi:hypothetical protein